MSAFATFELSDPRIALDGLRFATVKSAALGRRADVTLYAPPDVSADAPVVMLLHGVYGSHWAWAAKGAAHQTAARLIAEGVLPPMILCMPSDGLWGDGSGYVAHHERHSTIDYERWVIDEAPAVARQAFGTTASPLFVCGLSMGGFAALRLAGKYPSRIAAAAAHSAIINIAALDALIAEPRAGWSTAPSDLNVAIALLTSRGPLPPLWFDCGTDDNLLAANRELDRLLNDNGIPHVYVEHPGGHDWAYWRHALAKSLRFFGDVLAAR